MRSMRQGRGAARLTLVLTAAGLLAGCGSEGTVLQSFNTTTTARPATTARPTTTPPATARPATTVPGTATSTTRAGTSSTLPTPTGATGSAATSPISSRAPSPLFGVALGTEGELAIARLIAALGRPSSDTGWGIGCPLDDPVAKNERVLTFGRLRVHFGRAGSSGTGALGGYGFVIPAGETLAAGDPVRRLTLPAGVTLGAPMRTVATALGSPAEVVDVFGWVAVSTPGAMFTGDGSALNAPLNAVSVPTVFACE